jgi:ABC-type branched-subunit amino acid transport system substrate-binding protein
VTDRRVWIRTTVAVAAAGLLAGCSSGNGGGSGDSKGPITIGYIGSIQSAQYSFPEAAAGAQAYVDAINASGGVKGRKVRLITCNDQADPNQAAACVRQMTQGGALGVIGGITTEGQVITADLQSANLVYTGGRPLSPGELNSPISFPMVGGAASTAAGLAIYADKTLGCKRPFQLISDDAPTVLTGAAFTQAYKWASGGGAVGQVVTPSPDTSYAAAAASAVAYHADCVMLSLDVPEGPKALPVLRAALPHAKFLDTAGALTPVLSAVGKLADGIYAADSVIPIESTGNATLNEIKADMAKYEPKSLVDGFTVTSWLGTRLLLDTIGKISGSLSAQAVLNAYNHLGEITSGGVIGNFSFQHPSTIPDAKRQFNSTYIIFQYLNGAYKALTPFEDAAQALSS